MRTLMNSLYGNLDEAKAFALGFTNFVHTYDDTCYFDFAEDPCPVCDRAKQNRDYWFQKRTAKNPAESFLI